jgi:hypothetical protein
MAHRPLSRRHRRRRRIFFGWPPPPKNNAAELALAEVFFQPSSPEKISASYYRKSLR